MPHTIVDAKGSAEGPGPKAIHGARYSLDLQSPKGVGNVPSDGVEETCLQDESSSAEDDRQEFLDAAELRGLGEADTASIIGPVISRTHSIAARSLSDVNESSDDEAVEAIPQRRPQKSTTFPRGLREEQRRPDVLGLQASKKAHNQKGIISFSLPSIQLPSLPNINLPSFASAHSNIAHMLDRQKRKRARTFMGPPKDGESDGQLSSNTNAPSIRSLRRASSDTNISRRLHLNRAPSATSSLGDDAQFLHVQSMTNSRLKAIKDNLRTGLPSIPQLPYLQQQLANFNPFTPQSQASLNSLLPPSPLAHLDNLTGDVVVIGGYRGSVLRDKTVDKRIWIPLKVGLNLKKVNLEIGLEPGDEEKMSELVEAPEMLTHIGPIDISRRLIKRLRTDASRHNRRVHSPGYDWRLSPQLLSERLIHFLEALPCNQLSVGSEKSSQQSGRGALVIAHSLGGLIVRAAVNRRPELFSGVIYAGTPSHCVNILGPLRNGDSVLLNSQVFTAQVNFTLRSSFVFLPENGQCFIDRRTGKPLDLDFFDVETWKQYGLSPCVADRRTPTDPTNRSTPISNSLGPPNILGNAQPRDHMLEPQPGPSWSASSIPKAKAIAYLSRVLQETLKFKESLAFRRELAHIYPPAAVIYSKTTPTVRGAKVDGKSGIKRDDVYDDLLFGPGDGVCLSRAAMLPEGYGCVKKVAVDKGHLSLLGDLEAVAKCIEAIVQARGW